VIDKQTGIVRYINPDDLKRVLTINLTLEEAKLRSNSSDFIRTTGYRMDGDGGSGEYIRSVTPLPANVALLGFVDASGQQWVLTDAVIKPEQAGADGTVINDTPALLALQADNRHKLLNGAYKCNQDILLVDNAHWLGSGSIEFDGAMIYAGLQGVNDARHWEIGDLTLTRVGLPGPVVSLGSGARRFKMYCDIMGSTGKGIYISGAYLGEWHSPYIMNTANTAFDVREDIPSVTGLNAFKMIGGEIQNCGFIDGVPAVHLERTKKVIFDCTVEGCYSGIEFGRQNLGFAGTLYTEGLTNGSITSFPGQGQMAGGKIAAGTTIFMRTSEPFTPIDLKDIVNFVIEDGVAIYGYNSVTPVPLIKLGEAVNNRARGYVGLIANNLPLGLKDYLIHNNTHRYGKPVLRDVSPHTMPDADVDGAWPITYINLSNVSFPAAFLDIELLAKSGTSGDVMLQTKCVRTDGTDVGAWRTITLSVGTGPTILSLFDRITNGGFLEGNVAYLAIRRVWSDGADTAGDLKIIDGNVTTYENGVKYTVN